MLLLLLNVALSLSVLEGGRDFLLFSDSFLGNEGFVSDYFCAVKSLTHYEITLCDAVYMPLLCVCSLKNVELQ